MMMTSFLILPSLLLLAPAGDGKELFRDDFEGPLQSGWQWVREEKEEWRIRDGELQVRSQAGRIWGGNDAKNLLLFRPLPAQQAAARVSVAHQPKEKWEQAGPLWYVDDDNFVKLISEHIDGKMYVVIARELDGRGRVVGKIEVPSADLELRLKVESNRVTGQWRLEDADAWSDAGTCDFDAKGEPRFGLFTQNGPKDQVRWVRFDDFAITELPPSSAPAPAQESARGNLEEGFEPLFDGKSFDGWRVGESTPESWKVENGLLVLTGGRSHLFTQDEFDDFIVRFEWRPVKKGYNSGFFIRGRQIQMAQGGAGMLFGAEGTQGVPQLHRPPGQWNEWEVTCIGRKLSLKVNGKPAWEIDNFKPGRRSLGIEAEGHQIEFRNMRVKRFRKGE